MDDRHLSEDELLDRLYGVPTRSDIHLDACPDCRGRWNVLCRARAAELHRQPPDIVEAVLLQQRRKLLSVIRLKLVEECKNVRVRFQRWRWQWCAP